MKLAILLAALLCVAPLAAAVAPPPTEQADSDGGRSLNAFIDDGNGGVWREFPASDAGIAAFTDALNGRSIDAVAYSQDVKGAGAYLHSWTGDDGTPFVTVGAYVVSATQGKIRLPFAIVENVTDLGELSMLAASVVADDAMPIAAESFPHVYGLVAPDVLLSGILGGVGLVLVGELALTAVANVASIDGGEGAANLPPEAYPILEKASWSMIQMGFAFVFGQFGLGGTYIDNAPENLTYDWSDRPEVRIWVARKSAAGHDVWTGVAISRTGAHEGDGVSDFTAWKRISVGPVARVDGAIAAPAAAYARADVSRHYEDNADGDGPTAIENHYILTAGVAAAGADTPLAQVHMDETRDDSGDEGGDGVIGAELSGYGIAEGEATYLPESQQEGWSVGPVVAGTYTPLVGARTTSAHHGHADVNNLGQPDFEWDSERTTSAGVYVSGAYTPLVGAREWTERLPIELYAPVLALDGFGSQSAGDAEASVGVFLDGAYTPLAGARYDDDFEYHLHPYRGIASAGTYVQGVYSPLVGTTYDGEVTATTWAFGRANGNENGDQPWQTSAGSFTLGFYRPVVGARFVPATHDAAFPEQESYQLGVYPLLYDPFIPVASADYAGDGRSVHWVLAFADMQLAGGDAGTWHADIVAYTPGPFAFPLVGARYADDAPDASRAEEYHALVGVWGPDGFVPLVGAGYGGDGSVAEVALETALAAPAGGAHGTGVVSFGVYDPTTGGFVQVGAVDTADVPR